MTRIVATADFQGMAHLIDPGLIPNGEILLVAGDICGHGTLDELETFNIWLAKLPHKYKVLVGGNHSLALQSHDGHEIFKDHIYLQDELVEIEGLKIYGSPLSNMGNLYGRTPFIAFSSPDYVEEACEKIPDNLDILITHGGPFGILDQLVSGQSVGSKDLRDTVLRVNPRVHCFGHIHESHAELDLWGTKFINAAICSNFNQLFRDDGALYYPPITFDV